MQSEQRHISSSFHNIKLGSSPCMSWPDLVYLILQSLHQCPLLRAQEYSSLTVCMECLYFCGNVRLRVRNRVRMAFMCGNNVLNCADKVTEYNLHHWKLSNTTKIILQACTQVSVQVSVCTFRHAPPYTDTYEHAHTHTHLHKCTHAYTLLCARARTHTRTHKHTHAHTGRYWENF